METIKLGEICKVISRGYNYARNEICKEKFDYYSAPQISYSNVDDEDGTFDESEEMVLIRKETADRYWVKKNDIILPPTTTTLPRAKGIANYLTEKEDLKKLIYSQNVVFIRLEENSPITSIELIRLLNTPKMQNALLEKVYTKERVKSISLEKLRKFEIPIPTTLTDRQKERLNKYIEVSEKFYQAKKRFEEEFWEEDF